MAKIKANRDVSIGTINETGPGEENDPENDNDVSKWLKLILAIVTGLGSLALAINQFFK